MTYIHTLIRTQHTHSLTHTRTHTYTQLREKAAYTLNMRKYIHALDMHTCMHTYAHTCTNIHMNEGEIAYTPNTRTHGQFDIYIPLYTYEHACIHTYIRRVKTAYIKNIHIHNIQMHAFTYTYIHKGTNIRINT